LLSGPGCPVCVTSQKEIDTFVALAKIDDVIVTTFGDLMRVPGTGSSLQKERAEGRDIRMVYSTMDALEVARRNPTKQIVFLGVGFETTAPTIAAAILGAQQMKLDNFLVYSAHKLVPPALDALMASDEARIDGFILPGHVSVIIGTGAYQSFFDKYRLPCVVAGFEPTDLLQVILNLTEQIENGAPALTNAYDRAVTRTGNLKAQEVMQAVFDITDAVWRGIGVIPRSGLKIKPRLAAYDAEAAFALDVPDAPEPRGCACGQILTGTKIPPECPLYKTVCSPVDPVGPCMVSSEGTCAAYYRYHD
jgi:hydrogenase expression/formation protein HypD